MTDDPSPRAKAEPDGGAPERPRWRRGARIGAWMVGAVAVLLVLVVFVFPTRTYVQQHRQMQGTANELRILDQQNAQLAAQAAKLQTNAEIEQLAREQYHLVRPGEQAFAILPPPATGGATAARPAAHGGTGLWRRMTSWLP
jgi:cell division protein FtsB